MSVPKNLLPSVRLYFQNEVAGKFPISEADALIVGELRNALKKLQATEVVEILDQYKINRDEDVFDSLISAVDRIKVSNINSEEEGESSSKNQRVKKDWIEFAGTDVCLRADLLSSIRKDCFYDDEECKLVHILRLNETEATNVYYHNMEVKFNSLSHRDVAYDQAKNKIEQIYNIQFL